MDMITVRMDKDLKKRMRRHKDVNWSGVVRQAIIRILEQEEARNLAKAVLLNERNVMTPDEGYSSLETIRRWRETVRWKR